MFNVKTQSPVVISPSSNCITHVKHYPMTAIGQNTQTYTAPGGWAGRVRAIQLYLVTSGVADNRRPYVFLYDLSGEITRWIYLWAGYQVASTNRYYAWIPGANYSLTSNMTLEQQINALPDMEANQYIAIGVGVDNLQAGDSCNCDFLVDEWEDVK